jgi:hypothetical protein
VWFDRNPSPVTLRVPTSPYGRGELERVPILNS